MKSKESLRLSNLSQDLPTTQGDIIALRDSRRGKIIDLRTYLEFLKRFPVSPIHSLRDKKGPTGNRAFEL
jgi:hypothetical protein